MIISQFGWLGLAGWLACWLEHVISSASFSQPNKLHILGGVLQKKWSYIDFTIHLDIYSSTLQRIN